MKENLDRLNENKSSGTPLIRKMTKQEIEENKILTPPWPHSEKPSLKSIKKSIEEINCKLQEIQIQPKKPLVPGKLLFWACFIPVIILNAILVLLFLFAPSEPQKEIEPETVTEIATETLEKWESWEKGDDSDYLQNLTTEEINLLWELND
jgi:hypothetical protein